MFQPQRSEFPQPVPRGVADPHPVSARRTRGRASADPEWRRLLTHGINLPARILPPGTPPPA